MTARSDGGPAFPIRGSAQEHQFCGLSQRDYFAAKALQGAIAGGVEVVKAVVLSGLKQHGELLTPDQALARATYDMADAMLEARER